MQSKASLILKRLTNYRRFSTTWGFAKMGADSSRVSTFFFNLASYPALRY